MQPLLYHQLQLKATIVVLTILGYDPIRAYPGIIGNPITSPISEAINSVISPINGVYNMLSNTIQRPLNTAYNVLPNPFNLIGNPLNIPGAVLQSLSKIPSSIKSYIPPIIPPCSLLSLLSKFQSPSRLFGNIAKNVLPTNFFRSDGKKNSTAIRKMR